MIVLIEQLKTRLLIEDDGGDSYWKVFSEMPDATARQLVKEYGCKPSWVKRIVHDRIAYCHEVDETLVWAVLERLPNPEPYTKADVLRAVQCIVPQAVRIVRMRGGKLPELVFKNN